MSPEISDLVKKAMLKGIRKNTWNYILIKFKFRHICIYIYI